MSERDPLERASTNGTGGAVSPWGDLALATLVSMLADALADRLVSRLPPANEAHPDGDDLLSYEQVVDVLTATTPPPPANVQRPTTDYVRRLVKAGALPVVAYGKYVRVQRRDLLVWIDAHRDPGLDRNIYHRYTSDSDRRRATRHPLAKAAPQSGETRRPTRHDRHDGRPMGTGRARNRGDGGSLHPIACGPRDGESPSDQ